jgi:hypothetical protein
MMKLSAILFFLSGLFAPQWKYEFSREGITIWSKSVKDSEFREIKGYVCIPVDADRLWKGLNDYKKFMKIMTFVTELKDLESCGPNCKYVYQAFHKKPVKPRHFIVEMRWEESGDDAASKVIKQWWKKAKNKKPKGDLVEVNWTYGSWVLEAAAGGKKTKFTSSSYMDPGGVADFPFFVNKGGKQITWDFLSNLRKAAPHW